LVLATLAVSCTILSNSMDISFIQTSLSKLQLLQAELHYLNERHTMAELSYQSAIVSATEHKFLHEAALSCELYGIYLIENKDVERGLEQLKRAVELFAQWGAMVKAKELMVFIETMIDAAKSYKN